MPSKHTGCVFVTKEQTILLSIILYAEAGETDGVDELELFDADRVGEEVEEVE